jgi:O-antigen ligase
MVVPLDFDRCGPLLLLLPALWVGRGELAQALGRLRGGPRWLKLLASLTGVGLALSLFFARQFAPSLATAASWILLVGASLVAGQCVANDASAGRRMLAGLALGTAGGALVTWVWWVLTGRDTIPLYPHPRLFGLHALPGAVASLALWVHPENRRAGKTLWLAAGILTWGGLLWSGGRAPLFALAVAIPCWAFFSPPSQRPKLLGGAALLLTAGLALSAVFWTSDPQLGWWHAIDRTAAAASAGSVSQMSSTRSEFWLATVERAEKSPWLGYGPDAYRFLTPKLDGEQPHNFVLQAWLDLGLVGALPLLALLGAVLVLGWKRARRPDHAAALPWLAVLTASIAAGLLDGVFYHLLALLPAMLAFGVALSLVAADSNSASASPAPVSRAPWLLLGPAAAVTLLHLSVFYALNLGPTPAPTSWTARSVQRFPSTTFGLWRWLDDWQQTHPADALAWARWAQDRSPNPVTFHLYAMRLLLLRGDRAGAEKELQAAVAKAHRLMRPSLEAMLRQVQGTGDGGQETTGEKSSHP